MQNIIRMVKAENYTVFISYSSADLGIVKLLMEPIRQKGADCIIDQDILAAGVRVEEVIVDCIRKSHQLMILLTPEFAKSNWLLKEYGIALGAVLPVYAICLGVTPDEIKKLDILHGRKTIQLTEFELYLETLAQHVVQWRDAQDKDTPYTRIQKGLLPR